MQRHEMIDVMRGLGLKGMAGAFDDAVTTGVQRKRTAMEILTDLLRAEGAHRHAASIRYRMTAAKLPVVKDLDAFVFENTPINEGLVRSLHAGSFLPGRRNVRAGRGHRHRQDPPRQRDRRQRHPRGCTRPLLQHGRSCDAARGGDADRQGRRARRASAPPRARGARRAWLSAVRPARVASCCST